MTHPVKPDVEISYTGSSPNRVNLILADLYHRHGAVPENRKETIAKNNRPCEVDEMFVAIVFLTMSL